jgi:hypothetical protein
LAISTEHRSPSPWLLEWSSGPKCTMLGRALANELSSDAGHLYRLRLRCCFRSTVFCLCYWCLANTIASIWRVGSLVMHTLSSNRFLQRPDISCKYCTVIDFVSCGMWPSELCRGPPLLVHGLLHMIDSDVDRIRSTVAQVLCPRDDDCSIRSPQSTVSTSSINNDDTALSLVLLDLLHHLRSPTVLSP